MIPPHPNTNASGQAPREHCEICGAERSVRMMHAFETEEIDGHKVTIYNCRNRKKCAERRNKEITNHQAALKIRLERVIKPTA